MPIENLTRRDRLRMVMAGTEDTLKHFQQRVRKQWSNLYRGRVPADSAPLVALLDEIAEWASQMRQGVVELMAPPEPETRPLAETEADHADG